MIARKVSEFTKKEVTDRPLSFEIKKAETPQGFRPCSGSNLLFVL